MRKPKPAAPAAKHAPPTPAAPEPTPEALPLGELLLRALDDPNLFQPFFRGDTWRAWKVFLRALTAQPITAEDMELYTQCTGRSTTPSEPFDEAALIVGRRGGKSQILALIAVALSAFRDYTPYLAPGEVATVMIIAVDRKQARSIFRYISGLLKAVPLLSPLVAAETDDTITLTNRVVIEIGTASFRVTRGYNFAAVLADEIAFFRTDENSASPDIEILRALRPGLSLIDGSMLLMASSPYARRGALFDAYKRHWGKEAAPVMVFKAPTWVMNPKVKQRIIDEAYASDPESADAEFGANFRSDLAAFVDREIVDAVTISGRHELPPVDGIDYQAFCDPSGGSVDSFTLAIGHLREDGEAVVLDNLTEIKAPFDPEQATATLAAVMKRYRITRARSDRYSGEWARVEFRKHGIDLIQSVPPKSDIYHDFLPILNSRRVELLDNPRLVSQLCGLERRTSRSGKDAIDHAQNGHDDCVNSAAGVLTGLDLDRRPALVTQQDVLPESGVAEDLPAVVAGFYAVIAVSKEGQCAVVFGAMAVPTVSQVRLYICDFVLAPLRRSLFDDTVARLQELIGENRTQVPRPFCFAAPNICLQAAQSGLVFSPLPDAVAKSEDLLLSAAVRMSGGEVRITRDALDKAATSPLGAALTLRGGEGKQDDPLRVAVLQAVALALNTSR